MKTYIFCTEKRKKCNPLNYYKYAFNTLEDSMGSLERVSRDSVAVTLV